MQSDDRETVRGLLQAALKQLTQEPVGAEQVTEDNPAEAVRVVAIDGRQSHPGLERFPLSEPSATSAATKPCFMEPGRVCVNSGACEMRGY